MYDIFYIGPIDNEWSRIKTRFPLAKRVDTFQDAQKKSFTVYFWVVWKDISVLDNFNFDYKVSKWDTEYIHVFRNGQFYDGICLFPKKASVSKRELDFRWFVRKKEIDIVASTSRDTSFDIVFISYYETNAEENYQRLLSCAEPSRVYRVNGVKGIHQAHIEAAKLATTDMFWVVDGDAFIVDNFNFSYNDFERFTVHVWRSKNPINKLEYGYGGVKLLPRTLTLNMDINSPDMTTSISTKFKAVDVVSNITSFNTDPFNTWKSAFRECCKLASRSISRQDDSETTERLLAWCTLNDDVKYGFYAYLGALAGRKYGQENAGNLPALTKINDFNWLNEQFEQSRSLMETHRQ